MMKWITKTELEKKTELEVEEKLTERKVQQESGSEDEKENS